MFNKISKFFKYNLFHSTDVCALILSAGDGIRMESDIPKQLMEIEGIPVICHTLIAFEKCEMIKGIVLVVKEGYEVLYRKYAEKYNITKLDCIVSGAKTRAESVKNGLEKVGEKYGFVAIHDGVRCLVSQSDIVSVISEAYKYGAAIAATHSTDTVKISDKDGFVAHTPLRNDVWRAQTPQVFKKNLLIAAAYSSDNNVTDDSMWAERAGFKVKLVECSSRNIKLTTKDDIVIATEYLKNTK